MESCIPHGKVGVQDLFDQEQPWLHALLLLRIPAHHGMGMPSHHILPTESIKHNSRIPETRTFAYMFTKLEPHQNLKLNTALFYL